MFKNVAGQKIALFAFTTTNGVPKVGDAANISAYVSKDYGAVTQLTDTSASEMDSTNAPGWYLFDVSQAESNADALLFSGKSATASVSVVGQLVFTLPPNFTANVSQSGDSFARLGAPAGASVSADIATVASFVDTEVGAIKTQTDQLVFTGGRIDASIGAVQANAITAAGIATDAIGAAQIAASAIAEIQAGLSTLDAAGVRAAMGLASANLDTQLAAIASFIDTEVAAIKAKTDNLPANPAAVSDIPTAATIASAVLTLANGVETSFSLQAAMRLILSVCAAKISGGGTGTETIRDVGDTKNRLVFTVDANGNRTAVTRDIS